MLLINISLFRSPIRGSSSKGPGGLGPAEAEVLDFDLINPIRSPIMEFILNLDSAIAVDFGLAVSCISRIIDIISGAQLETR